MAGLRRMLDGYDCGIRYMDGHIGRLFEALEEAGVMDGLAVIVTSDHGENQGELAIYGEHATADRVTCRIPMIVRWPGGVRGGVDEKFRYNLDLAPTVAELLGAKPHPAWDGRGYAGAVTGGGAEGHDGVVLSQCAHVCQRGVRFGRWLYMRTYHDGFHLWPAEMLYDVDGDPHEQTDLAAERADVCREGAWRLAEWHDRMMRTMPGEHVEDPLWRVMKEGGPMHARGHLAGYCRRLEATGRGWAVPELKRRHPGEFA
jgi:arylsulfatase A-like enzyme